MFSSVFLNGIRCNFPSVSQEVCFYCPSKKFIRFLARADASSPAGGSWADNLFGANVYRHGAERELEHRHDLCAHRGKVVVSGWDEAFLYVRGGRPWDIGANDLGPG